MAIELSDDILYHERHRQDLEAMFKEVLGNNNVYFAPPETKKLSYECIVYDRVSGDQTFANNTPYKTDRRYTVTVISKDPDTLTPDKLATKEKCTFDRSFCTDNLYHFVFTVY